MTDVRIRDIRYRSDRLVDNQVDRTRFISFFRTSLLKDGCVIGSTPSHTTHKRASGGMVDTPVLGTGEATRVGSSPISPTKCSYR